MEQITERDIEFDKTVNLSRLINSRIISKNGSVIGKVSQVRINPITFKVEGVVIRRGILKKPVYVGSGYFERMSNDAIILNIDPSITLKGKKVVNPEGKILGEVRQVNRIKNTNEVRTIVVHSLFKKPLHITTREIQSLNHSIMLKHGRKKDRNN